MDTTTHLRSFLELVTATPTWFPQLFDEVSGRVLMVRRSEADYRAASFLDQRSLPLDAERHLVAWDALTRAFPSDCRRDAQYIFHIGHVGSTLISRLLGELEPVLALREPLILRTFAEAMGAVTSATSPDAASEVHVDTLTALLSRTFRPEQRAIIKATSFVSEIGYRLLPQGSRALFLYARPRRYIEGILAGDASRQELQILAQSRLERLQRRVGTLDLNLSTLGPAHQAAIAWACEMTSLEASAGKLGRDTVMWVDFDCFLADATRGFVGIASFFGHPVEPSAATAICSGPLVRRYSKALEYEYSSQLRNDVLAEAGRKYALSISLSLDWLDGLAGRSAEIAQALTRAGQEQHV